MNSEKPFCTKIFLAGLFITVKTLETPKITRQWRTAIEIYIQLYTNIHRENISCEAEVRQIDGSIDKHMVDRWMSFTH